MWFFFFCIYSRVFFSLSVVPPILAFIILDDTVPWIHHRCRIRLTKIFFNFERIDYIRYSRNKESHVYRWHSPEKAPFKCRNHSMSFSLSHTKTHSKTTATTITIRNSRITIYMENMPTTWFTDDMYTVAYGLYRHTHERKNTSSRNLLNRCVMVFCELNCLNLSCGH